MTRLDFIGLTVDDLGASLAFYRLLGVPIAEGAEESEHGHVEAELPGGMRLGWDTVDVIRSFDPEWTPPSGSDRIGLAFLCDSPADVDSTYRQLVDAGYEGYKEPWDAFWGQRYAQIKDPDGNTVSLFASL